MALGPGLGLWSAAGFQAGSVGVAAPPAQNEPQSLGNFLWFIRFRCRTARGGRFRFLLVAFPLRLNVGSLASANAAPISWVFRRGPFLRTPNNSTMQRARTRCFPSQFRPVQQPSKFEERSWGIAFHQRRPGPTPQTRHFAAAKNLCLLVPATPHQPNATPMMASWRTTTNVGYNLRSSVFHV